MKYSPKCAINQVIFNIFGVAFNKDSFFFFFFGSQNSSGLVSSGFGKSHFVFPVMKNFEDILKINYLDNLLSDLSRLIDI